MRDREIQRPVVWGRVVVSESRVGGEARWYQAKACSRYDGHHTSVGINR